MRKVLSAIAGLIPNQVKEFLVGSPARPSWIADAIHGLLNKIPGEPNPILPCKGFLEGYRMKVDWSRFRAFAYGTWEPEVVRAVAEVVHEGSMAIDIGAHLGYYALILSRIVGPTGKVIAFEPIPSNFRILTENIEMNNCRNVQLVNKAVSNCPGQIKGFLPTESDLPSSFSLLKSDGERTFSLSATSLDYFLNGSDRPVDFIEIDVEGAEGLVLEGARKTIERFHPILLVEVHHFGSNLESSKVPNQLLSLDYELNWLLKWHDTSHVLATWKGHTSNVANKTVQEL